MPEGPPMLNVRVVGDESGVVVEWTANGATDHAITMTHRGALELAAAIKRVASKHIPIEIAEKIT